MLGSGEVLRKAFRAAEFRAVLNDKPKGMLNGFVWRSSVHVYIPHLLHSYEHILIDNKRQSR